MKGNRSDQSRRGRWQKDRAERGIFQRGRTYYVRYADQDGKVRAERVGPSKVVALKVVQKRRTEVAERRFFPASGVLFEEIVDDAIALAKKTFGMKHPGKKFKPGNYGIIKQWFPNRRADTITPSEISDKLTEHAKCAATFNRFRVAISHTYKVAMENKKVVENPARLIRLQKENNERVRYLNQFQKRRGETEEDALRAAVRRLCSEKEPEIDLALHTGMRWGEQYHLLWQDVDLIRNVIKIVQPKAGKDQYVPINAAARRALARLKSLAGKSKLVCPANDYDKHRDWWCKVLEAAKINDFHWHDLRHTFASRLVMRGADIYTVCRLMRHKNIQVTMRYAHLADQRLAEAVSLLEGAGVTVGVTSRNKGQATRPAYLQ